MWDGITFGEESYEMMLYSNTKYITTKINVELKGEAKEKGHESARRYLSVKWRYNRGREVGSVDEGCRQIDITNGTTWMIGRTVDENGAWEPLGDPTGPFGDTTKSFGDLTRSFGDSTRLFGDPATSSENLTWLFGDLVGAPTILSGDHTSQFRDPWDPIRSNENPSRSIENPTSSVRGPTRSDGVPNKPVRGFIKPIEGLRRVQGRGGRGLPRPSSLRVLVLDPRDSQNPRSPVASEPRSPVASEPRSPVASGPRTPGAAEPQGPHASGFPGPLGLPI